MTNHRRQGGAALQYRSGLIGAELFDVFFEALRTQRILALGAFVHVRYFNNNQNRLQDYN